MIMLIWVFGIGFLALEWLIWSRRRRQNRPKNRIYYRSLAANERILAQCPSLQDYQPPLWGVHPHLQILAAWFADRNFPITDPDYHHQLELDDGGTLTIDGWHAQRIDQPALILLPTICGHSQELARLIAEFRSCWMGSIWVFNRRGHEGVPLTSPIVNSMGSTKDLRQQIHHLRQLMPDVPFYMVGLSAGSGLLFRYLGEFAEYSGLKAAVAVSPAYDIERAFARVHLGYSTLMTKRLRRYFLHRHQSSLQCVNGYQYCDQAKNLSEFHDRLFPLAGFESREQYYQNCNPMKTASSVRTRLLTLNADDDPICIGKNVDEHLQFFTVENDNSILVRTRYGGHCAFIGTAQLSISNCFGFSKQKPKENSAPPVSWLVKVVIEYCQAVENDRI